MKKLLNRGFLLMTSLLFSAALAVSVYGQSQKGWVTRDGKWYYYSKSGTMAQNQWLKIGNNLFWMDEEGAMARETWVKQDKCWFYMSSAGAAASGWQEIEGKWYYFDKETNIMQTNITIDNWYVGEDGAWDPSR